MRRSKIRAIVAAAVVFAIVVSSIVGLMAFYAAPPSNDGGDATAAPAQMYFPRVARADNSIVGAVMDPNGKPAAKVLVRLYMKKSDASEGRRALGWTRTREDGRFVIDNVPPGKAHYLLCNTTDQPTVMHTDLHLDIAPFETVDLGTLTLKTGRY